MLQSYSVGATCNGVRNTDAKCRLGTYMETNGTQRVKHADIAFLDMPHSACTATSPTGSSSG